MRGHEFRAAQPANRIVGRSPATASATAERHRAPQLASLMTPAAFGGTTRCFARRPCCPWSQAPVTSSTASGCAARRAPRNASPNDANPARNLATPRARELVTASLRQSPDFTVQVM
jgi:hypothetical protein